MKIILSKDLGPYTILKDMFDILEKYPSPSTESEAMQKVKVPGGKQARQQQKANWIWYVSISQM